MKIFYSGKRNNFYFFQESLSELLTWEHLFFFSFLGWEIEAKFGIRMTLREAGRYINAKELHYPYVHHQRECPGIQAQLFQNFVWIGLIPMALASDLSASRLEILEAICL